MDGSGASGGEGCLGNRCETYAARFFSRAGVCFRTNESPRFSSALRSADSVAILTGSPADSCPIEPPKRKQADCDFRVDFFWAGMSRENVSSPKALQF